MSNPIHIENRRDVATRQVRFFQRLAKSLVRKGYTPNQVSILSTVFALIAGLALAYSSEIEPEWGLLIIAILGIQLRLVCNLIDGLMAVEGGLKTPAGEIFNDVPDRISDILIIMGAAWGAQKFYPWAIHAGWLAAILSVLTAYVRTLGASLTGRHDFSGPMAKQHRMFLMTIAVAGASLEFFGILSRGFSLSFALILIALGAFATCIRRLVRLNEDLNTKL